MRKKHSRIQQNDVNNDERILVLRRTTKRLKLINTTHEEQTIKHSNVISRKANTITQYNQNNATPQTESRDTTMKK